MYKTVLMISLLTATIACEAKKPAGSKQGGETPAPTTPAPQTPAEPASELPGDPGPLVMASNALAFDLYKTIQSSKGNLAFSPASISLAFAMTYAGAKGATAAEMKQVLHLPGDETLQSSAAGLLESWNAPGNGYELKVVNRLFGEKKYEFEQSFLDLTKSVYKAPLELLDFKGQPEAQRVHINAWVHEQTEERISDLLPEGSINEYTRLVLTNAVYFLGQWANAFDVNQTTASNFHVNGGEAIEVPTMRQTESFAFAQTDGVRLLRMPYAESSLAMTIALPEEVNGLGTLEASLSLALYERWSGLLDMSGAEVRVALPSFKVADAQLRLKESLQALGMRLAFDEEDADFTAMANPPKTADQLYITDAFHKAFVKVDEKGTEAAAATAVVMGTKGAGMPPEPVSFTADHPFLFIIEDTDTRAILFLGRVVDPR